MDSIVCSESDTEAAGDTPNNTMKGQKRKRSLFEGDLLRVSVNGDGEMRSYHVHQDLLYEQSLYFAALSNFKEGEEAHVTLHDMDQTAFQNIVHWLYKGVFDPDLGHRANDLILTWAAADYLMMNKCKNAVIDELRRLNVTRVMNTEDLILVKQLGHMRSTLAQYIVDQLSYDCIAVQEFDGDPFTIKELEPMPIDAVCTLMEGIVKTATAWAKSKLDYTRQPPDPATLKGCRYHNHDEEEDCYLKKEEEEEEEKKHRHRFLDSVIMPV